jgi:hypothetical protein
MDLSTLFCRPVVAGQITVFTDAQHSMNPRPLVQAAALPTRSLRSAPIEPGVIFASLGTSKSLITDVFLNYVRRIFFLVTPYDFDMALYMLHTD